MFRLLWPPSISEYSNHFLAIYCTKLLHAAFVNFPHLLTHAVPSCIFHILRPCEFSTLLLWHKGTYVRRPPPLDYELVYQVLGGWIAPSGKYQIAAQELRRQMWYGRTTKCRTINAAAVD